ncbi:MAG: hypothetical protein ACLQVD_20575 [Capsulimonadaceae bacterium]
MQEICYGKSNVPADGEAAEGLEVAVGVVGVVGALAPGGVVDVGAVLVGQVAGQVVAEAVRLRCRAGAGLGGQASRGRAGRSRQR